MSTQKQDTETLFKKKLNVSIGILVLVIVSIILSGILSIVYGSSPIIFMPSLILNSSAAIGYAVGLVIFSGIGKVKGKENRIMSFVFGILTLVLSALLIEDRAVKIANNVDNLIQEFALFTTSSMYIISAIVRSAWFVLAIVILVNAISSIVNSVAIIKANVPSSKTQTTRPVASSTISSPGMSMPPPASAGARAQFCSSCGAPLEAGAVFCNKCGAKV